MTIANWCVLAAILLPYVSFALAVRIAAAQGVVRDNRNPRDFPSQLSGKARRAWNAQINSFEALPAFAAAVVIAELAAAPQARVDMLAGAWVLLRLIYIWLYLADQDKLRSTVNLAALACIIGMFILAA